MYAFPGFLRQDPKPAFMAKGLFTQSLCLLLRSLPDAALIENCLGTPLAPAPPDPCWTSPAQSWWLAAEELGSNGKVAVDLLAGAWPDECGDQDQADLFQAWCLGYLGPLTFPGGLQRAARERPPEEVQHSGVLHLKSSFVLGADDEASALPDGYDPQLELAFLHGLLKSLTDLPQVVAYYNPSAEVLWPHPNWNSLDGLPLWIGTHTFATDRSQIVTTVGMEQLDLLDHQIEADSEQLTLAQLTDFVRQQAAAQLARGCPSPQGLKVEALGCTWQAREDESVGPRPRSAVCWAAPKTRPKKWFGW